MNEPGHEVHDELHHHALLELFDELSFPEQVRRVMRGLKQPRDSGEYKWAKLQVIRLSAPVSAVAVPLAAIVLMAVFGAMAGPVSRIVKVQIVEPQEMPELDDVKDIKEEPPQPPEPMDMEFTPDVTISDAPVPGPPTEFSPQPAQFDAVAMVKSPVIMKGIYGSRSPGMRGAAMARGGAPAGVEDAVMRALRWLKKNQAEDGSWPTHKAAMTGLALLAFLAHGETPSSEEFGQTVEKAIKWLLEHRDGMGGWPRRYEHEIATYAMCEAYGMTKVPAVKEAAEKAIDILIRGQNPKGGWRYTLTPADESDSTVMGWCAQALKAAKMAGLENAGLDGAMKNAVQGFRGNYQDGGAGGGFGYTSPGIGGLTGAGVLSMQLLGFASSTEVKKGLVTLNDATFNWEGGGKYNKNYYWYYITQAKFHAGGDTWKAWNALFAPTLVKRQTIIPLAIEGPDKKMKDIGWWEMANEITGHTDGDVMNTALCTLQLEVYYRYLPTYMTPAQLEEAAGAGAGAGGGAGGGGAGAGPAPAKEDVDIQVNI